MAGNITRRFFIGGSAAFGAFGAFGGCRLVKTTSRFRAGETPRLRFGVISDVHICWRGNLPTFRHTLEEFRAAGVDAVMICGDIVDLGVVSDLEAVAETWNAVFPGNRAPDGRRVEKVFVTGNHDWAGHNYGKAVRKKFPDPAAFAKNVLRTDFKGHWERIFDEPWAPVYRKTVNGYTFVGAHWAVNDCNGRNEDFNHGIKAFYDAHAGAFDPARPFFHAQHPHPRGTCYGPWAWGRDTGVTTSVLSAFPNAVAFSGHSHYTLTDDRSVWQGAFTSVGTGSLRYSAVTVDEPAGYENYSGGDTQKTMPRIATGNGRQGLIVSVYDDALSIARREFLTDGSLGDDWVMPLPAAESKPFAFAARAKSALAPEFAPGAGLIVAKKKGRTRAAAEGASAVVDTLTLRFPAARSTARVRVYDYEVVFTGRDGTRSLRRVVAPGFHLPLAHKSVSAPVTCSFAVRSLPKGPLRVEVRPRSSFRKVGRAIVAETV
jgi:hypothetical protein